MNASPESDGPDASTDMATAAWDALAERLDALAAAWDGGQPPASLEPFLPAEPPSLRRHAMVEVVKLDMERRWRHEQPKQIEQYVADLPELAAAGVPCDLIYEEYHIRTQAGDQPTYDEYFARFPDRAAELRRLFDMPGTTRTTSFYTALPARQLEVGDELDDFELLGRLGKGAFATVFLARQQSMQRLVALKISADQGREPQTLAQLDHPNIVRVFDQRQLPDDGLRLLYMQYLSGGALDAVIKQVRDVPPPERSGKLLADAIDQVVQQAPAARQDDASAEHDQAIARLRAMPWTEVVCCLGARLAAALEYAHGHGVLHRDLKPANILLGADGQPLLADFNISFNAKADGVGAAAYFGGSLAYMSPEQLEACNPAHDRTPDQLDGRSDIYSLGVVLWELLTGERPITDTETPGWRKDPLTKMAAARHAGVPPVAQQQLPEDAQRGLTAILIKCLAGEADDRFAHAAQLARQLELCQKPRVQMLLYDPPGWAIGWLRRTPLLTLAIAVLLPNLVLSVLNISYNLRAAVPAGAQSIFTGQVAVINVLAYGLGLALSGAMAWPLVRGVSHLGHGEILEASQKTNLCRRGLALGESVSWLIMAAWAACGVAFAVSMNAMTETSTSVGVFHFILSQVGCGLMAGTLSFFLLTFLNVRGVLPLLIDPDHADERMARKMLALARRTWWYLGLLVAVPFVSVVLLALSDSDFNEAFMALGILGALGIVITLPLSLTIRGDLAALAEVVDPSAARDAV